MPLDQHQQDELRDQYRAEILRSLRTCTDPLEDKQMQAKARYDLQENLCGYARLKLVIRAASGDQSLSQPALDKIQNWALKQEEGHDAFISAMARDEQVGDTVERHFMEPLKGIQITERKFQGKSNFSTTHHFDSVLETTADYLSNHMTITSLQDNIGVGPDPMGASKGIVAGLAGASLLWGGLIAATMFVKGCLFDKKPLEKELHPKKPNAPFVAPPDEHPGKPAILPQPLPEKKSELGKLRDANPERKTGNSL